jgi:uncharacterized protein (DUF362 family)/NAD-dependent dihydropyrimidine dehydrogenase PreA subunit
MDQPQTVSLYKCTAYDNHTVKETIIKLGDAVSGGWPSIVPKGSKVLLKTNFLLPADAERAVTTHPVIVKAVAELCAELGARKIVIGDSPGFGSALKVASTCGIMDVARSLNIEVVNFSETKIVSTPQGFLHKNFAIAQEALESDVIINLPKFKTHAMMGLTMAVKNLFGMLVGKQKARWHLQSGRDYRHFARMLVELAYTVRPTFSILDAIVGMEGNGPSNGEPRNFNFLAASQDMNSLDRVATEIAGVSTDSVYTLRAAADMGFNIELKNITIIGDALHSIQQAPIKLASEQNLEHFITFPIPGMAWLLRTFFTTKPFINTERCSLCGRCVEVCPVGCMTQEEQQPISIDHNRCIRCFCCQELCPGGAVTAKDAMALRLFKACRLT